MKFLNVREFAEHLRIEGNEWADEILEALDATSELFALNKDEVKTLNQQLRDVNSRLEAFYE